MRTFRSVAIALTVLFSVASAEASPITGAFSIVGNFRPVNGQTGASATLGLATGLNFLNLLPGGPASGPGLPGSMLVTQANGNLAALTGTYGLIRDFSFAGAGSTNYPNLSVPLVSFQSIGGLTFTLTSVAVQQQSNSVLTLLGQGMLNMAGYTSTAGTFNFTGNSAGWPCSVVDFWSAPPSSAVVVAPARPDNHRDHTRIRRDEGPVGLVSSRFQIPPQLNPLRHHATRVGPSCLRRDQRSLRIDPNMRAPWAEV